MIPFSVTATSHLILTFSYALSFFIAINIIGIRYQKESWLKIFLPSGVPLLVIPALFIIEIISYFARVVSLSVRLFANMLSGHILLKILIGFA
jgi:F-type H+-transporting ATPase subunit a